MFGFALLGCLVAQLAGHTGWTSTLEKMLRNTLANGVLPARIPLNAVFCQGMPKSTLNNNLAPGTNSQAYQGKTAAWAQTSLSLRRYTGSDVAVPFWKEI